MQADYPAQFSRETGCTEQEWLGWLPAAVGNCPMVIDGQAATVRIDAGVLRLSWAALAPRRIALMHLPRMQVSYAFEGIPQARRLAFMRRFDLYMQRGGG